MEPILHRLDLCAKYQPPGLNVTRSCVGLSIGGAGSRTLHGLLHTYGFERPVHDHTLSISTFMKGNYSIDKPGAPCFLLTLREPALRLESGFAAFDWAPPDSDEPVHRTHTIDNIVRILVDPLHPAHALEIARSKEKGVPNLERKVGVPDFGARGVPLLPRYLTTDGENKNNTIDCLRSKVAVKMFCLETLEEQLASFVSSHKTPIKATTSHVVNSTPEIMTEHVPMCVRAATSRSSRRESSVRKCETS